MYQCVDGFDEIMEYFIKTTTPFDFVSSWEDDGRTWERGCWILLPNFLSYLDRFSLNFFKKTKREEKNNCHPFISSLHEHPICSVPNNLVDVGPKQKGRKRNVVHDTPRQDDGLRSYVLFCCSKSDSILLFLFYFFFPDTLLPISSSSDQELGIYIAHYGIWNVQLERNRPASPASTHSFF